MTVKFLSVSNLNYLDRLELLLRLRLLDLDFECGDLDLDFDFDFECDRERDLDLYKNLIKLDLLRNFLASLNENFFEMKIGKSFKISS